MKHPFVLGSRGSALALVQTELTRAALLRAFPEMPVEVQTFVTRGDQKLDLSLIRSTEAGGKGLFTKELEDALFAKTIDVAVHSLKDLPGINPPGLHVAAVLERAPTADMLISRSVGGFDGLSQGAHIGTSSIRRARQLQWLRPDLVVEEFRGNVQTRLRKLGTSGTLSAIVLAQAGLERLGFPVGAGAIEFEGMRFEVTSLADKLLPAIGQGAIALQSCTDRPDVSEVLGAINHVPTFMAVRAERELQRLLAGDCTLPIGVRTNLEGNQMKMEVLLFGEEGIPPRRVQAEGAASDPEALAATVFSQLS
ncbi:hydroxymethylbilane synthase [Verrucomicrobiota bacterium sgz303538]